MPSPQYLDCEARFFSRATGLRLAVNPDETLSLAWELVESGGAGQITCELAHAFDDLAWPVQGGDILEIWVLGTGETVPRCRGSVGHYDKTLDRTEKFLLTGYGRMEDMNHVLFDRILLQPGGADLAYFAGQIADDYAKRRPGLRFVRDIQTTGVFLERLDQTDTTARAGVDALQAQSGGNVVWGWDIDPQTGLDRFYLRPKVSVAGSQFFAGGNVKLVSSPSELQGIVNAMKIEGGPAKYPQLMTNPSFEVPSLPDSATGSLLLNGGFESGTHGSVDPNSGDSAGGNQDILAWSCAGGATRNAHDPGTNHNSSAHTGNWYVLLDQAGKEVWQEVAVTPGAVTYCASLFCAREKGSFAAQGTLIVEGRSASGAVLETYSLPLMPASTAWTGGQPTTTLSSDGLSLNISFASAGTTKARIRLVAGLNGSGVGGNTQGLVVDDVTFADASAVGQTGWSTHLQNPGSGANKFLSVDWACRAAAWEGFYGLRVNVLADGTDRPAIAPAPGDQTSGNGFHYKPGPQQNLRTGFRVRMSPGLSGGSGNVFAEYREWAADGHETQFQSQPFTVPNDGQWHFCFLDISAHGDADTATTQATIAASGWYDFDGFTARDAQAGEGGAPSDPLGVQTFLRGADFEIYVTAEQVCTSGSAADALASASASLYGRQEGVVKNDQVVGWNPDSVQWAAAYFGRVAVPVDRPQVQLDHEPVQMPSPGSGKQVRVSGLRPDAQGIQDWCAKAAYAWAKMKLSVSLDLDSTRPTWAKLLLNIGAAGGGGSAGAIAAVAGGGGGGTSTPAAAPVTSVNAKIGAVVLGAGDVGAEPALGNPPADGYVSSSTKAGVRSWIAPAAGGGGGGIPEVPSWLYQKLNIEPGVGVAPDMTAFTPAISLPLFTTSGDLVDLNASRASRTTCWGQKAYYTTELTVLTAKAIQVQCTADNTAQCYLNGAAVGSNFGDSVGGPGSLGNPLTISLTLTKGRNVLSFQFFQDNDGGAGNSGFTCTGVGGPLASLVDQQLAPQPGGGAATPATAAALGTVKTDITESGGSVVYTKTTLDSLVYTRAATDTLLAGKISVGATLAESEITGLLSDLAGKITAGTSLPESEISGLVSDLAGKIAAGTALPESEISGLLSDLAGKMVAGAAIPESEITSLAADLAARLVVAGTPAVGQVPVVTAVSPLAVQWQTPTAGGPGLSLTESLGSGSDLSLTAVYQSVPGISISVGANAAVDADALVEIVADAANGGDDLYLQLFDTIAGAAIPYSERHVSTIPAGKRGQIALSKYVAGAAAGRTLVLQARNAAAARGTLNTNKCLLQALGISGGTSAGGGITSPAQVAGLAYWLKGSAVTGLADGAAVASWPDSSGNGHAATQATAAAQPIYKASGLNGKPALRFNGSSQYLTLGDLSGLFPAAASLFIVATYNGLQNQCLYSTSPYDSASQTGDDYSYFQSNGGGYFSQFRTPRTAQFGPMPSTGSNLFSLVSGPSSFEVWVNQVNNVALSSTFAPGTNHLIGHSNCAANTAYLLGDISEIIAYSAALSQADRQNVEGYLKAQYGI